MARPRPHVKSGLSFRFAQYAKLHLGPWQRSSPGTKLHTTVDFPLLFPLIVIARCVHLKNLHIGVQVFLEDAADKPHQLSIKIHFFLLGLRTDDSDFSIEKHRFALFNSFSNSSFFLE